MPIEIDIDAEDLASQVVTIQRLPDPQQGDVRGGPTEDGWVTVAENVPTLLALTGTNQKVVGEQIVTVAAGKALFFSHVTLGPTYRLLYQDPTRGERTFRPEVARDAAEVGALWVADIEEIP